MTHMYNNLLYGTDNSFMDYDSFSVPVHREVVKPFLVLQSKARQQGFELSIASGYRSFDRQLLIWNEKVSGVRPVIDDHGNTIDLKELSPWQQVQAILRWSALPGTSRHHWGTDLDVFDKAAVAEDYQLQLSVDEVADSGPFGPMHLWLDQQILNQQAEGFFRPYNVDRGGVSPERWHLSYGPLARSMQSSLDVDGLRKLWESVPLSHSETIIAHMDEILERYVIIPDLL